MTEHSIIDRKEFIALLKSELDPTRSDPKSKPDMSWVLPMVKDTLFEEVLIMTRGNQAKASRLLGVNRGTLIERMTRIRKNKTAM